MADTYKLKKDNEFNKIKRNSESMMQYKYIHHLDSLKEKKEMSVYRIEMDHADFQALVNHDYIVCHDMNNTEIHLHLTGMNYSEMHDCLIESLRYHL